MPLARPAGRVRALEQRVQALPKVGEGRRFLSYVQGVLAEDADFEYTMIDGSIVKVHRHGQGAKGGLKAKPSDALAAG